MKKSVRSQKEITKKSQKSLQAILHHLVVEILSEMILIYDNILYFLEILQMIFNYYLIITAYNKNQKYINKNLFQALDQLYKYSLLQ
ncbi:hypothetical protein pb186bvf_009217 [Paramecium bursaria]